MSGVPIRHVAFGLSAAGDLRKAMELAGRPDDVVGLPDDLTMGPLDPGDAESRMRWVSETLECDDEDDAMWSARIEAFWSEALSAEHRLIGWFCRRSTGEYCGYLEWLRRLGERRPEVVDVTGVILRDRRGKDCVYPAVAVIPADTIMRNGLLDAARPLAVDEWRRDLAQWRRLRAENAPFRAFVDGDLVSVPITHFDERLLSFAGPAWQKAARVIGGQLVAQYDENRMEVGDLALWARLRALVAAGRLESRGDLLTMRTTEVRLPPAG